MQAWQRKAIVSNTKALIPFRDQLRSIYRQLHPYETNLPTNDELLRDALKLARLAQEYSGGLSGSAVLELGTGWIPVTTLLLTLLQPRRVVLTDQERLLDARTFDGARALLLQHADDIAATLGLARDDIDAALAPSRHDTSLDARLAKRGMQYHVPFNFSAAESASLDVIVSRAVLEHVRPDFLRTFTQESLRLLRRGGLFCHIIDHSDHWEHGDKSISRVNFLQYPDWMFRLTHVNAQDYQNRWRHSDYVRLFKEAGFNVVHEERHVDAQSKLALGRLRLAPRFAAYDPDDLATIQSLIIARRPA